MSKRIGNRMALAVEWTIHVKGEGDTGYSRTGLLTELHAAEWAERMIRQGDWDVGDSVAYWLSRDGVRTDTDHRFTI